MDELEIAMKEAYSLVPGTYTGNMRYIGAAETKYGNILRFYSKDSTGEYLYDSIAMDKFDREMREAERRRRRCLAK